MTNPPTATPRDARWLWLLFAAAWGVHLACSLVGWDNTLLSRFQFRQVQTAMAALFFPGHGFALDYELPLFGPPWSAPLEFPLYQACVSWLAALTGLNLDATGRLVSWLYFQCALPAYFLLLGSLGLKRPQRFIGLALLVTSPLYLFFSRFFLMESTAFCFSLWFLAALARWLTTHRAIWLVVASCTGAVAAGVKPPTVVVFSVAGGLFVCWLWWRDPARTRGNSRAAAAALAARACAAFVVPVVLGLAWQVHTGAVRARNPETAFLDVMFGFFSFGDLAQRFSLDFWRRTVEVWTSGILSEGGLVLGVFLFARARAAQRPLVLGAVAAFLSGQLIFSNLYYVHDYYFYATGVFLLLALGLLLAAQFDDETMPRWSRWGLPVLIIALQLITYSRVYLPIQRTNNEVPEYIRVVRELTRPGDVIVILGQDWDASIPYYAQRRALMLISGRERDPAAIEHSIARVDPATVGAVLIFGQLRNDSTFAERTMARLQLGPTPILLGDKLQLGIWIPRERRAEVRDKLPARPYATLDTVAARPPAGTEHTLGVREISQLRPFSVLPQLPVRATSVTGFSTSDVGVRHVLNAHAPSELVFRAAPAARSIRAMFGIHDGAYTHPGDKTDGVEFVVALRPPGGPERVLFTRLLDPVNRAGDQGIQQLDLSFESPLNGEIIFRTLPGPRGIANSDWAYLGQIEIR